MDRERVGAMGIFAGGGYSVNAAINDRRIKAVATVSAVNVGAMVNRGFVGDQPLKNALAILDAGAQARTKEANGEEIAFGTI